VLLRPRIRLERKTARLYEELTSDDLARPSPIGAPEQITGLHLANTFMRPLYDLIPDLVKWSDAIRSVAGRRPFLSGAGPTHYLPYRVLSDAVAELKALRTVETAVPIDTYLCRTVGTGMIAVSHRNDKPDSLVGEIASDGSAAFTRKQLADE
jgi:hypothetical protein